MSVSRGAKRRLPKGARREQILAAALAAFLEGGYHGTHVEAVVARAGIARGTFYLHFDSKRDVFAALVERMLAIFLDARPSDSETEIRDRATAEVVLRNSYRAVLSTFRENRRLCRLLFEEAVGVEQGFAAQLAAHYEVWRRRVQDTLQRMVDVGVARADLDVETTATVVVGGVEHVTRRYVLPEPEPDLEALVEALVQMELGGVR
jgi:AcrR family transcriptional regulator